MAQWQLFLTLDKRSHASKFLSLEKDPVFFGFFGIFGNGVEFGAKLLTFACLLTIAGRPLRWVGAESPGHWLLAGTKGRPQALSPVTERGFLLSESAFLCRTALARHALQA